MENIDKIYNINNPSELNKNKKLDYIQLYTCFVDLHNKYNNLKNDFNEKELKLKNEIKELEIEKKSYYNKKNSLEDVMNDIKNMSGQFF